MKTSVVRFCQMAKTKKMSCAATIGVSAGVLGGVVGGFWLQRHLASPNNAPPRTLVPHVPHDPLPYLSDSVFESTDNMLVFMFASEEMYAEQLPTVNALVSRFAQERGERENLFNVKLLYTIVPPSHSGAKVASDKVEIMCYKGQRKLRTSVPPVSAETQYAEYFSDWNEFFALRSEQPAANLAADFIPHISGAEFKNHVIDSQVPVLVQVFEKSCFLCFLMRPFINSVALLVNDFVPWKIVRLDIEENDFPEGLGVVRGTPTFVLFKNGHPIRWTEFKPRDLTQKIFRDYPQIPQPIREKVEQLVEKVALRFQAFSGLIMWNTEADKLVDLIANGHEPVDQFNEVVSEMMVEDMTKTDGLDENLQSLLVQLGQAEMHAIMMAQILAEKVIRLETGETRS